MRLANAIFLHVCPSSAAGCATNASSAGQGVPMSPPSPVPASAPWYVRVQPRPAGELNPLGTLPHPTTREDALKYLMEIRTFGDRGGFANEVTPPTRAFAVLLAQPDAAAALGELLKRGRVAGQLYALCGLYLTDRALFDRKMPRFLNRNEEVWRTYGCTVLSRPVREVAPHIASGFWPSALEEAARELQAAR